MKKRTVVFAFIVSAYAVYGLADVETLRTQFQSAKAYGASARDDADLNLSKESSVNFVRAIKLFSGLVRDAQVALQNGCDAKDEDEIKAILEYALYAEVVCWSEISAPEKSIPSFRKRAVDGCAAYLKLSPLKKWVPEVSEIKKEIESGKLSDYKNTLCFRAGTADRYPLTDSTMIEDIKTHSRKMAGQTLVFKGLYLGMQKSHAITLLKSYGCDIHSVSLYGRDGKVETFILNRDTVDVLFKTTGVSADNFCKTFVSAYPIVGNIITKTEIVPDVERQRKYINDEEHSAATRAAAFSRNETESFQLGVALGAKARSDAKQFTKAVPVYFHESEKGFVFELRPDNPGAFFTLKQISKVNLSNFD